MKRNDDLFRETVVNEPVNWGEDDDEGKERRRAFWFNQILSFYLCSRFLIDTSMNSSFLSLLILSRIGILLYLRYSSSKIRFRELHSAFDVRSMICFLLLPSVWGVILLCRSWMCVHIDILAHSLVANMKRNARKLPSDETMCKEERHQLTDWILKSNWNPLSPLFLSPSASVLKHHREA